MLFLTHWCTHTCTHNITTRSATLVHYNIKSFSSIGLGRVVEKKRNTPKTFRNFWSNRTIPSWVMYWTHHLLYDVNALSGCLLLINSENSLWTISATNSSVQVCLIRVNLKKMIRKESNRLCVKQGTVKVLIQLMYMNLQYVWW